VLRRVGISSLANLRLPPVPSPLDAAADLLFDLLDALLLLGEDIHRLRLEAESTALVPVTPRDLREGAFFEQTALSNETWSPGTVVLRAELADLAGDLGWTPLRDLAQADYRGRLRSLPQGAHALRLSDVSDDLFVAIQENPPDSSGVTDGRIL